MIDPETGLPIDIDPNTGLPIAPAPYAPTAPPGYGPHITNTNDPTRASLEDRLFAYQQGEELNRGLNADQAAAQAERARYGSAADEIYNPLAQGRGGVAPADMQNILRQDELGGLGLTGDEQADSFLSDYEQQQTLGLPNSRRKWFNPNQEHQSFDETQGFRRGAVDSYERNMADSYNPNALRAGGKFYNALAGGASDYAGNSRDILDPSGLTVSDEFLSDYRMTPEEEQRIVTGAGITSGTRDKAAIAEAERRARAAGTNPLGVAALRERSTRGMNANAADAMTQARIGASEAAANRLKTGEGMRLQYGQNLAGMRADNERSIADAGYRATMGAEGVRGAGERDVADRRMQVTDAAGRMRVGNETDLGRERLNLLQSISTRGNETERDVDDAYTSRMRDTALNRQAATLRNQDQRYTRGVAAGDRLSDRYRYATDAARGDAKEARGYYTGQVEMTNANTQRAADRRVAGYGATTQAGQGATRTQAGIDQYEDQKPKWWEKLLGAGLGAAGSYFGARTR